MKRSEFNLWMEALESDQYEQGRSYLKSIDNKFCCLGVFCEAMGISPTLPETDPPEMQQCYFYEEASCGLPYSIEKKYGFYGEFGETKEDAEAAFDDPVESEFALARLNDSGKTFKEIAAIIKENPEKFFKLEED